MKNKLATVKENYTAKQKEESINRMKAVDRKRQIMLQQMDNDLGRLYSMEVRQETISKEKVRILTKIGQGLRQLLP